MSGRESSSSSGTSRFTFVTDNSQSEARSHAMREHWKHRHRRKQAAKSHPRRASRILPRSKLNKHTSQPPNGLTDGSAGWREDIPDDDREQEPNAATQLLSGFSHALSISRPDPFQTCPIHLTGQHQKLLYHCRFNGQIDRDYGNLAY